MQNEDANTSLISQLIEQDFERVLAIKALVTADEQRVASISALTALNAQQTAMIAQLLTLDGERVAAIAALMALNAEHAAKIERLLPLDGERVSAIAALTALNAEHAAKIERLLPLDGERVAAIAALTALNAEHAAKIERLLPLDGERVAAITALTAVTADQAAKIERLLPLDGERVATISALMAQNADCVATVEVLMTQNAVRVDQLKQMAAQDAERVKRIEELSANVTASDGLTVSGRNLSFLDEPVFASAWRVSEKANAEGWPQGVPDIRFRAHLALWAARQALALPGDFIECGVHTGLLSLVVCHALKFAELDRHFYLFDTFNGVPIAGLSGKELEIAQRSNAAYYRDVWDIAVRNFSPFPNAKLIRGNLPDTLGHVALDKISYLSVDLNSAAVERAVMERLWNKLVPGALVLIDDYAWRGLEAQHEMWNDFARSVGVPVAALPTGQGLIIKQR